MLNCTLLGLSATLGAASLMTLSPSSSPRSFSVVSSRFSHSLNTAFRFSAFNLNAHFKRTQFLNMINSAIRVSSLFLHNAHIYDRQDFSQAPRKDEVTVDSCMFRNCRTHEPNTDGGAIYVTGLYTELSTVRSSFSGCQTNQGGNGGAVAFNSEKLYMLETCFADCHTSSTREQDTNHGGAVSAMALRDITLCGCSFYGCPLDTSAVSRPDLQQVAVMLMSGNHDIDDSNFTSNHYRKSCSALSTNGAVKLELKYVAFYNNSGSVVLQIEDPSQHTIQNMNLVENDLTNGKNEAQHGIIEFSTENLEFEDCFFKVFNQEEHNKVIACSTHEVLIKFRDCNFDLGQNDYGAINAKYEFDGDCKFNYDGPSNPISVFNSEECWFVEPERRPVGATSYMFILFLFLFMAFIGAGIFFEVKELFFDGVSLTRAAGNNDMQTPIAATESYTNDQ